MKDTPDRPDEPLPVRRSLLPPVAAPPPEHFDDYADQASTTAPPKRVSFRLVSRALRRHWLIALVLWLGGSAALVALAYHKIKPTFDAVSRVSVVVDTLKVLDNVSGTIDLPQFMETQVSKITSPVILTMALVDNPKLRNYPLLNGSDDPEADLRAALRVGVVPRTNLIQIEMSSPEHGEAAEMVNAVVKSYLDIALQTNDSFTKSQIERFRGVRDGQLTEVNKQRKVIEDLQRQIGAASENAVKDRNIATLEAYRRWSEELTNMEIRTIAATAKLDQLRNEKTAPARPLDDESLTEAVRVAFYEDARIAAIERELKRAESKLRDVVRVSRSPNDPAVVHARQRVQDLNDEKNDLWAKLEPTIRRQLIVAPTDDTIGKQVQEAEATLQASRTQEEVLRDRLDKVKVQDRNAQGESLKLEFARRDLARAEDFLDKMNRSLEQLELEAKNPTARINLEFKARPTRKPNADRRTQLMAAAPFAFGLFVVGLLTLVELRGARVSDPDELAHRMKLQVIGTVPPLPQIRAGGPVGGGGLPAVNGDHRAQRQLDEFVQSLDHLRVALCARPDPWGRDRHCVLITSACGSEGKTTLAAQLAERCVNAGMMTLLIDADLRNPTLSRMLDAPDAPGLINILKGEVTAEDVIMVIGDAGGFHLIPAGTPRVDPSRLLQSDRLAKLIAQARESFDMIIIDAPPVLPVPDALTIGRWTDGAVLAVRYDTSRFPLVERANRRLAHVGVPVIGAVVNGVRSMESSYGGYAYGYGGYGSSYGSTTAVPPAAPVVDE